MNNIEKDYFKNKLIKEKKKVEALIDQLKENEAIDSNEEFASELSTYDNHTGDLGEELFNKEKSIAIKGNEYHILNKIETALKSIENEKYGICEGCGKNIPKERLEFLPYANQCVKCQEKENELQSDNVLSKINKDEFLKNPFSYGINDYRDKTYFDCEDSLQSVDRINYIDGVPEYEYDNDEVYVEPIEAISNEEYKKQLPD
ncbi:TraR/DksA C4-type zinc finger protein [Clostridium frigidicarnis]|uniref:RNA polymerase-binding protein DksA n=1 Tax=Clostridium frigidicarnis TaxID=84698 RepID=A0A1I0WHF9_9CLOT|nr:TraR/DksA C4-type zinc finger protein [Clostridium frigidicarnis]SFA88182.1 RNA polymerase-binding protein DksA [Clostridium frigidicarnis]